jgi:hypothetical protein
MHTCNNTEITRRPGFQPGNPGRPKGARNRATALAEQLLSKDVKDVVASVVNAAKEGDMFAAKLVLERILPPVKSHRVSFPMRPIQTVEDISAAFDGLWEACSQGGITPEEASMLAGMLEKHKDVLQARDHERRLTVVEEALNKRDDIR